MGFWELFCNWEEDVVLESVKEDRTDTATQNRLEETKKLKSLRGQCTYTEQSVSTAPAWKHHPPVFLYIDYIDVMIGLATYLISV